MADQIIVDPRFCGPKDSGNGGYVSGLLARRIDGPAEVTLRKPPPLGRNLAVHPTEDGVALMDGELLIAEARPTTMDESVPDPPSFDDAVRAAKAYRGFTFHPLPHCFVCGILHEDGMRIYAGPVADPDIVAAPWVPEASLADEEGTVRSEFVWAALDCPAFFAIPKPGVRLLGRLAVKIMGSVNVDDRTIAMGWHIDTTGRKSTTGTALFAENGDLLGIGRSVWIELK